MRVELPGANAADVQLEVQTRGLRMRLPGRMRLDLPLPLAVRYCPCSTAQSSPQQAPAYAALLRLLWYIMTAGKRLGRSSTPLCCRT